MAKKYRLYDFYEGCDFLGDFDTMLEVRRAALQYDADTDGECCLRVSRFYKDVGRYEFLQRWTY